MAMTRTTRNLRHGRTLEIKSIFGDLTIDIVKAVSGLAKASVTPQEMVIGANLSNLAARTGDANLAKFAIQIRVWFPLQATDIIYHSGRFSDWISRGWTEALEELIITTGAPFKHAVRNGKIDVRRGLPREHASSPLLQAALSGTLKAVRFFEGERAMNAYR
jgi:hypothetical protein